MKQLLIISGKGGTGKTTIAAAFIRLSNAKGYADCDVDAPNLHLSLKQVKEPLKKDFYGMDKAVIIEEACIGCGQCEMHCAFNAIHFDGTSYRVDSLLCEGCGVCEWVCDADAVKMTPYVAGETMLYENGHVFSTAELKMGSGNSGKLVTEVKKNLTDHSDATFAVVDGSPGIGCPVIASLAGVDMALIVTEPTQSGLSDLTRIHKTATVSGVRTAVCVNKYDINTKVTAEIRDYCDQNQIPVLMDIPYDKMAGQAVNKHMTIVDFECKAKPFVAQAYHQIKALMRGI